MPCSSNPLIRTYNPTPPLFCFITDPPSLVRRQIIFLVSSSSSSFTGVDLSKILGWQTKLLGGKALKVTYIHGHFSVIGGTCPGCPPKYTPMSSFIFSHLLILLQWYKRMIGVYVLIDFSAPILIQFEPIATVYSFHLMKKEVLLSSFFLLPSFFYS